MWDTLKDNLIGSDHFPRICQIGNDVDVDVNVEEIMPRWKFKSVDWDKFKESSEFLIIWGKGSLPTTWKHGTIIPIAKPGRDHSVATSYRPIALTSNLCKIMKRMVIFRLNHVLESKGYFSPFQ